MGESDSGKSVFTKAFMGYLDASGSITGGSILYKNMDLATFSTEKELLKVRGREIAIVLQDPMTSLDNGFRPRPAKCEGVGPGSRGSRYA